MLLPILVEVKWKRRVKGHNISKFSELLVYHHNLTTTYDVSGSQIKPERHRCSVFLATNITYIQEQFQKFVSGTCALKYFTSSKNVDLSKPSYFI